MGTTLSNGVYLPDEGERNCYAGLKVNWEILNQKVADISALQLAIAGALHREIVESLPTTDIDPNTIYMVLSGTSATENVYNEFMYVNNAWELIGTSATDLTNYYTKAEVDGKLLLKANDSDVVHKDQNNKLTGTNQFDGSVVLPAFGSPNYQNYGIATSRGYSRYDNYYKFLRTTGVFGTDNTPDTSKPSFLTFRPYHLKTEIMDNVVAHNDGANNYLAPITNNATDLGTSTNKWKTLNGVEPSSLGMPDLSNGIDISSYLINIGTSTPSEYTPSVNGWLVLKIASTQGYVSIRVSSANGIDNYVYSERTDAGGLPTDGGYTYEKFASCITPCIKNDKLDIYILPSMTSVVSAYFYPCLGNV